MILALSILNAALIVALAVCLFLLAEVRSPYRNTLRNYIYKHLGPLGIRGWFIGQWRRLTGFRPDYRMTPAPRPKKASRSRRCTARLSAKLKMG
jgi:hypothetical protein